LEELRAGQVAAVEARAGQLHLVEREVAKRASARIQAAQIPRIERQPEPLRLFGGLPDAHAALRCGSRRTPSRQAPVNKASLHSTCTRFARRRSEQDRSALRSRAWKKSASCARAFGSRARMNSERANRPPRRSARLR